MLNPEFRLLDPDSEQLVRIAMLAPAAQENRDEYFFMKNDPQALKTLITQTLHQLNQPGIHFNRTIQNRLRSNSESLGMVFPRKTYFGWPAEFLEARLASQLAAQVLLFGILDAAGIWAGGLLGVSRGGIDFLATFNLLWLDNPELASKQSLHDIHELSQIVSTRFLRPAYGLFIYRNEFFIWREHHWSREVLEDFLRNGTAVEHPLRRQ